MRKLIKKGVNHFVWKRVAFFTDNTLEQKRKDGVSIDKVQMKWDLFESGTNNWQIYSVYSN